MYLETGTASTFSYDELLKLEGPIEDGACCYRSLQLLLPAQ